MTNTIERQIVSISLDTKELSRGVKGSMEEIDKLKKSMDLEGVGKNSFNNLKKLSTVDFNPMSNAIDGVSTKISLMSVAAAAAVVRITNSIIDLGKRITNALVFDPIRTGLEEYETQLNAVQTILANTQKAGTTLEDVNGALDELNRYADLTIYNFTQMTENIGKFTAAGVDLDTSVSSIKGIANLAALSGSNAVQASTAMYQLSQAIASGVVRLQDWNSVQNAGMGGQVFQDALIETARLYDENIDQMIEKSGGFRNSLQENWLTAQILTETLTKFTGDLSQEQLEAMGYTRQQAEEIVKMAATANDAATKIKTFTQLIDTMKEALQSGWAATWRIIFGDFEQAKELWGTIAGVLGDMIEASSNARNEMLELWSASGGRTALIEGFMNILQAAVNILTAFKEAVAEIFAPLDYVDLFQITFAFLQFSESIKEGSQNLEPFRTVVKALASVLDIVRLALLAVLQPLLDYVATLGPAANTFGDFVLRIAEAIIEFRNFATETGFFDQVVAAVIERVGRFVEIIQDVVNAFLQLDVIQTVVGWLQSIQRDDLIRWWGVFVGAIISVRDGLFTFISIVSRVGRAISELGAIQALSEWLQSIQRDDLIRWWNSFLTVLKAVVSPLALLAFYIKTAYDELVKLEVVQDIAAYFQSISFESFAEGISGITESIKELIDGVRESDVVEALFEYLNTFDGRRISAFIGELGERFKGLKDSIKEAVSGFGSFEDAGTTGTTDSGQRSERIAAFINELTAAAGQIDYTQLFDTLINALSAGLIAAFGIGAAKAFGNIKGIFDTIFGDDSAIAKVSDSLSGVLDTLQSSLSAVQNNIKADTLQKIAISIGILAGSLILLTLVDANKLRDAAAAIAIMTATLFGGAGALSAINVQDAIKAAVAVTGLSAALLIASAALVNISRLDPASIETSLLTMAAGLVGLVTSVNAISTNDAGLIKTVGILGGLAGTLYLLVGVIRRLGEMNPDDLQQGLAGVAASLTAVVGSITILSKSSGGSVGAGIAVLEISAALLTLSSAVEKFGKLEIDVLMQGLQTVGALLTGFAVFSRLLQPAGLIQAGVGLLIMSGALIVMADAMATFGNFSLQEMQTGLIGLAIALGALVIAANLMVGALPGAAATLIMSAAIFVLAGALTVLSAIPMEGLLVALAGLAGVFLVLGVAGLLMAPLVPILLGLGAAMLLFGVAAALLGVGILAASTGLVALAAAGAAVGGAIAVIGAAIIQIIPEIGSAIAEGMTNFLQTIATNMPKILKAWNDILLGLLEATIGMIPEMVAAIMDMVTQLLEAIASRLPDLIQAGFDILLAFIQGIEDNIAEVVAAGLGVLTEFLNGIAEGIPDLIDAAFNIILTFLNSIADAVEEYMPKILEAGARIGTALLQGVGNAIADGAQAIIDAILDLANRAIDVFKSFWGIESPSTLMYEMVGYIFQGFINGVEAMSDGVDTSIKDFFGKVRQGLIPILSALSDDISDDMELNPVISPVVDLSQLDSTSRAINSLFGGVPISGLIAGDAGYAQTANTATTAGGKVVNFVQNNYSPKALDRIEIYRQSKTYAAKLATMEL